MAIELKGDWLQTVTGSWVNTTHIDLIEIRQGDEQWEIVAWNAFQAQVEPHVLAAYKNESDAKKNLTKLVDSIAS